MKITIKDLAEKAGVSKTAVSFAFNNPKRISKETYDRIMSIAREIGYSPDPVARILATRITQTIALLLPQTITETLESPYIAEMIRGIGSICEEKGLALTLLSPQEGIFTHTIQNAAVDGMIILGFDADSEVHELIGQRKMPYVAVDAGISDNYTTLTIDEVAISEEMMDHLIENGHKKICFGSLKALSRSLSSSDKSKTMEARLKGIYNSVQKHHMEHDIDQNFSFAKIDVSFDSAYEYAKKVLSSPDRPTAFFCMGDIQAFGVYRAAQELQLSIPEELSVVSFDDLPINKVLYPELTTVNQPGFEKGQIAAQMLIDKINGEIVENRKLCVSISYRQSVAKTKN